MPALRHSLALRSIRVTALMKNICWLLRLMWSSYGVKPPNHRSMMGSVVSSLFLRSSACSGSGRGWFVQDALQVFRKREDNGVNVGLKFGQRSSSYRQLLSLGLRLANRGNDTEHVTQSNEAKLLLFSRPMWEETNQQRKYQPVYLSAWGQDRPSPPRCVSVFASADPRRKLSISPVIAAPHFVWTFQRIMFYCDRFWPLRKAPPGAGPPASASSLSCGFWTSRRSWATSGTACGGNNGETGSEQEKRLHYSV